MIHLLLTPPGQETIQDNLGVAIIGNECGDLAVTLALAMSRDGWTVGMIPAPDFYFPEDHPMRARARIYIDEYLEARHAISSPAPADQRRS